MFTIIMSLYTVDSKDPCCWPEILLRGCKAQGTHLVPDSKTTLACLIPFGMRSLMTSRMIRDPMNVYSADNKETMNEWGFTAHRESEVFLCYCYGESGCSRRNSPAFAFLSLSFSLPCRGLGGGVGAGPVPLHTSLEQYGMNLPKRRRPHVLV